MKQLIRIAVTVVAAAGLLLVADRVLQPVPVPAATAALGGLIGMWLDRPARSSWIGPGLVVGLLAGVGWHLYVHLSGGSPPPFESLAAHLARDGGIGLAVAVPVVVIVLLVSRLLSKILGSSGSTSH